jgi:3-oxoacyl-[acyl-carrier-protein] synthase-3
MRLSSSSLVATFLLSMAGSTVAFQPTSFLGQTATSKNSMTQQTSPCRKSSLSMVTSGPLNCRIAGIGSAAPKTVITNADLESVVETSDEWISTRTGISQRRVLLQPDENNDETLKTLASDAAKNALEMSSLSPEEIDLVLVATSSPDDMFGDATSVAASLGCVNAMAFDLTAACSGFLFGSVTAGQFLENKGNSYKNAIVVGADALSRWIDWDDRNSCILFGDGAGAVVLTANDEPGNAGILGSSAHSNGLKYDKLMCGYEGSPVKVETPGDGTILSKGSYKRLEMEGKEVYKFATREVPTVITEALEAADMSVDDVDWLLLHQANIRIMETVAKRLGIPMDKVITNLASYGNTSAASIPLALDEAVRSGQVKKGDVIACAGFGAGLSWGSAIMKWG